MEHELCACRGWTIYASASAADGMWIYLYMYICEYSRPLTGHFWGLKIECFIDNSVNTSKQQNILFKEISDQSFPHNCPILERGWTKEDGMGKLDSSSAMERQAQATPPFHLCNFIQREGSAGGLWPFLSQRSAKGFCIGLFYYMLPATLLGPQFQSMLQFPFFLRNPEKSRTGTSIHVHDPYMEIFHVQVRFFTSMYLCQLRSNYVQLRFLHIYQKNHRR